jgi:hypothetical protein
MKILSFLEKNGIKFKRIGQNYVCRCPICKGDNQMHKHNAQINPNFNNIYCYSEGKVYFASDIRSAVKGKAL